MRFFFHIGYNGANYRGWQRQDGIHNVQQVLETTIGQVLRTPVSIMGCGRTDAMVHASQFFFHLDTAEGWDFDLMFRVNKNLPSDIAIFEILPVGDDHHARFDAIQRTYDYFIHTYKDPFLNPVSALYLERNLHLDKMKEAVNLLPRYNDFRPFCKSPNEYEHTLCNITSTKLLTDPTGDRIRFQISANRFLGRMIRIIVGKLLEIGKGQMSVSEFEHYLIALETPKTIEPAYPQGLFLSKVTYPYLDIPPRTTFSSILQDRMDVWQPA